MRCMSYLENGRPAIEIFFTYSWVHYTSRICYYESAHNRSPSNPNGTNKCSTLILGPPLRVLMCPNLHRLVS